MLDIEFIQKKTTQTEKLELDLSDLTRDLTRDQNLDQKLEQTIRPKKLSEYIGQTKVREQMEIFIYAAKKRREALDHVLLFGPPGLGKTTLANIIANELQVNLKQTSGPALEKAGDLAAILTNLQQGDVLFIDEIHRLSAPIEEILYPAMEDNQLDLIIGEGPGAQSVKIDLPGFTLVGATTRAGLLTAPLRDRFGILQRLEFYQVCDLEKIINRNCQILGLSCSESARTEVARRARGTPRIANRLLRRIRDYADYYEKNILDLELVKQALNLLEVDPIGLDKLDQKLLVTLLEKFDGGPVGVDSLAAAMGETRGTLEELIEPYLIQENFLMRTSRGRVATDKAKQHFNGQL